MRDYKSRQSDLSFSRPKRSWRKMLRWAVGLVIAAGAFFGIIHLGLPWLGGSNGPETDADIIPLPLPPHPEPEGNTEPANSNPDS
jgi:hypothetical protein